MARGQSASEHSLWDCGERLYAERHAKMSHLTEHLRRPARDRMWAMNMRDTGRRNGGRMRALFRVAARHPVRH